MINAVKWGSSSGKSLLDRSSAIRRGKYVLGWEMELNYVKPQASKQVSQQPSKKASKQANKQAPHTHTEVFFLTSDSSGEGGRGLFDRLLNNVRRGSEHFPSHIVDEQFEMLTKPLGAKHGSADAQRFQCVHFRTTKGGGKAEEMRDFSQRGTS